MRQPASTSPNWQTASIPHCAGSGPAQSFPKHSTPMGAESIPELYERLAAKFDRARSRKLLERSWLERFTALIPPGGRVLDVGCGMGQPIGQHLVASGFSVTGVDAAPSLVELARRRLPEARWIVGDMRELALQDRFDGILAWDVLFHLSPSDQRLTLPRLALHALPGAPFLFTSGPEAGDLIGQFEGEPLYHGSLSVEEYRRLLDSLGFDVLDFVPDDPSCGSHCVWLARARQ
jgi:SAM-dependent methyltransferase